MNRLHNYRYTQFRLRYSAVSYRRLEQLKRLLHHQQFRGHHRSHHHKLEMTSDDQFFFDFVSAFYPNISLRDTSNHRFIALLRPA